MGETYLRRINCEYRDYLADQLRALGLAVRVGFQSEREDWIQMMVAAGFGVCFLPEILADHPRRTHAAGHQSGGNPTGLASFDVGAALFAGGDDLYPRDPVSRLVKERRRRGRLKDETPNVARLTAGILPSAQRAQHVDDFFGLGPASEIHVHEGVANDPRLIDDKGGRYRDEPAGVAVPLLEIDT